MKNVFLLLILSVLVCHLEAQTLQQVTANGNVTNGSIIINGNLGLPGDTEIQGGNGDAASYQTNNFYIRGWWGLGMKTFDGNTNGYYDFRGGLWDVKTGYRLNGSAGMFTGNEDNASFTGNNMYLQSWFGIGFKSLFDNVNRIYFNTRNGDIGTLGTINAAGVNVSGITHFGLTSNNYNPNTGNWGNAGSNIILDAADFSTIAFHDAGQRVDFIRSGGGTIQLGYDGGWGQANIGLPGGTWNSAGNVGIGTTDTHGSRLAVN